jgi:hypothetical protein
MPAAANASNPFLELTRRTTVGDEADIDPAVRLEPAAAIVRYLSAMLRAHGGSPAGAQRSPPGGGLQGFAR